MDRERGWDKKEEFKSQKGRLEVISILASLLPLSNNLVILISSFLCSNVKLLDT